MSQTPDHEDLAVIRARASKLLESSDNADITSAATLLKTVADIQVQHATVARTNADREKLLKDMKEGRSYWKDVISAATPLISSGILAGTLIFQIWQTRLADQEKRNDTVRQRAISEQTRITEAMKTVQAAEGISPAMALLNSFPDEPQKSAARQMELKLLLRTKNFSDFRDIFSASFEPLNPSDAPYVLQLNRSLFEIYRVGLRRKRPKDRSHPTPEDLQTDTAEEEIDYIAPKIAAIIQRSASEHSNLDLSRMMIKRTDLTGLNLQHDNFTGAMFDQVEFEGADLSGIHDFEGASFIYSTWWHAARIDPALLRYLESDSPYYPDGVYPPQKPTSAVDFETNVKRLEASAKVSRSEK